MGRKHENLRTGAIVAGAAIFGAGATATAGHLIDSGDVRNHSLKERDLARGVAKKFSTSRYSLASNMFSYDTTEYVAPGTDNYWGSGEGIDAYAPTPVAPPGATKARGLAVDALQDKGGGPVDGITVRLVKNGAGTSLKCTTGAAGKCHDTATINAPAGSELLLKVDQDGKSNASVTATLVLESK